VQHQACNGAGEGSSSEKVKYETFLSVVILYIAIIRTFSVNLLSSAENPRGRLQPDQQVFNWNVTCSNGMCDSSLKQMMVQDISGSSERRVLDGPHIC
jgi:hypothetical protein